MFALTQKVTPLAPHKTPGYQPEVDGLRAVAVFAVILFHAGFELFPGGYVGVDIFFVISGYLIFSIVLREAQANNFSLVKFYERRARRILPALFVVLFVTTIMAYVLMPPNLLTQYSQSLVAVLLFSSNIYFYLTSDYFATDAEEKPLLHTWSLGVEEQFYMLFPIIIMLILPFGKKPLLATLATIALASLATAEVLHISGHPNANFYLIFSRCWELLLGALLVLLPAGAKNLSRKTREIWSALGFILILISITLFGDTTPFPSRYTLLPVIGSCLLIVYARHDTTVGKLLSSKTLVLMGLISYSLYLWHQPIFAFMRMKSVGEPHTLQFTSAIVLTILMAFVTWKYVEQPFRNKTLYSRKAIFSLSAACMSIFFAIGLAGHYGDGFKVRFTEPAFANTIKQSPMKENCFTWGKNYKKPSEACKYFGDHITWAVFGDSHADELAFALAKQLEPFNQGLIHLSFGACPPILNYTVKDPGCSDWYREAVAYLKDSDVDNILLAFRHISYLRGSQKNEYPGIPKKNKLGEILELDLPQNKAGFQELYKQELNLLVNTLTETGKKVFVLYPVPELPLDIEKGMWPISILSKKTLLNLEKSTTKEYYKRRQAPAIEALNSINFSDKVVALDPTKTICDLTHCSAIKNGKALYYDDDHLSVEGAKLLISNFNLVGDDATQSANSMSLSDYY